MNKKVAGIAVAVIVILSGAGLVYLTISFGNNATRGDLNIAIASIGNQPAGKNATSIYVTFSKVAVESNSSVWKTHSLDNTSVNILANATKNRDIASFTINATGYSAIKLYFTSITVDLNDSNRTFSPTSGNITDYTFQNQSFSQNNYFLVHPHGTTILLFEFHSSSDLNYTTDTFSPNPKVLTTF